ncbi:MAG: phage tail protein [Methylocella sp.]
MTPFLGQIMLVGFNFAPTGWAMCNGQLLSISQNTALFSLLGTTYGGDGVQNFALPDLRGRVAVGMGQGPGLSNYVQGQATGSETVALTVNQMPAHSHLVGANAANATVASPRGADLAQSLEPSGRGTPVNTYSTPPMTAPVTLDPATVQPSGGSQPHSNIQPVLAMNYIIALQGVFPSRS